MRDMKATQSEWCNQRQGDSICIKKFLPGKIMTYKEMRSILPWYNTMKCQLQSMSGTLLQIVNYNPKFILGNLPTKDVSYSVSECQVCKYLVLYFCEPFAF